MPRKKTANTAQAKKNIDLETAPTVLPKRAQPRVSDKTEGSNINIKRITEQRLLDTKIVRQHGWRMGSIISISLGLGIAAGALVIGYLLFTGNSAPTESVSEIIVPPPPSPQTTETQKQNQEEVPKVVLQTVEILETPTGYLNVRAGAGTNFKKVAEVHPGESFDLLTEDVQKGWYEIRVSEEISGWVSKQYAKIK